MLLGFVQLPQFSQGNANQDNVDRAKPEGVTFGHLDCDRPAYPDYRLRYPFFDPSLNLARKRKVFDRDSHRDEATTGIWADPKRTMEHDLRPLSELLTLEKEGSGAKSPTQRTRDNASRPQVNDIWSDPKTVMEYDLVKDPLWFQLDRVVHQFPWDKEIDSPKPRLHRHQEIARKPVSDIWSDPKTVMEYDLVKDPLWFQLDRVVHRYSWEQEEIDASEPSIEDDAGHGWDVGTDNGWDTFGDDETAYSDELTDSEQFGGWYEDGANSTWGDWVDSDLQTAEDSEGQSDESQPDEASSAPSDDQEVSQVATAGAPTDVFDEPIGQASHAQHIPHQGTTHGAARDTCPVGTVVIHYEGGAGEAGNRTITVLKAQATGWVIVAQVSGHLNSGEIHLLPSLF